MDCNDSSVSASLYKRDRLLRTAGHVSARLTDLRNDSDLSSPVLLDQKDVCKIAELCALVRADHLTVKVQNGVWVLMDGYGSHRPLTILEAFLWKHFAVLPAAFR